MNFILERVPAPHRATLDHWIATSGPQTVASSLAWLAHYLLVHDPQGRLFGLSAPELDVLVQELTTLNPPPTTPL